MPYVDDLALYAWSMPGGASILYSLLCRICCTCLGPPSAARAWEGFAMSYRLCSGCPLMPGTLEWGGVVSRVQWVLWSMSTGEVCGGAGRCEANAAGRPGDVHPTHRRPAGSARRGGV